MESIGQKTRGKPVFPPAVEEQRRIWWERVKEGGYFKSSLTVPRHGKSYSQVKLIWGNMIANTILQADEKGIDVSALLGYLVAADIPKGVKIDEGFLHQLMYVICPTTDDNGKKVTLSKMNTEQASSLFTRYCNIMAAAGINIDPPPDRDLKT